MDVTTVRNESIAIKCSDLRVVLDVLAHEDEMITSPHNIKVYSLIILQNVKSGGTAAQDSQSEANEGRCPALPPTYCSAFILSASQTLTMD